MNQVNAAIAWYSASEYRKFKDDSVDPDVWCEDYESWKAEAESTLQAIRNQGVRAVKIPIALDEFRSWCRENKKRNDGAARSQYAASKLHAQSGNGT